MMKLTLDNLEEDFLSRLLFLEPRLIDYKKKVKKLRFIEMFEV